MLNLTFILAYICGIKKGPACYIAYLDVLLAHESLKSLFVPFVAFVALPLQVYTDVM